jgi:hypothetical protein
MAIQSIKSSNISIALATNSMQGCYMVGSDMTPVRSRHRVVEVERPLRRPRPILAQWRAAATNSTPRTLGKTGFGSRAREDKDRVAASVSKL